MEKAAEVDSKMEEKVWITIINDLHLRIIAMETQLKNMEIERRLTTLETLVDNGRA